MNLTISGIKSTADKVSNYISSKAKGAYKELHEVNSDLKTNIKNISKEIKDVREVGQVNKSGVTDDVVLERLWPATKGIEDYAKANNINITFHTPQKPVESGSMDFEKPLTITAYKNGFKNSYFSERTIDGDVNSISKAQVEMPSKGKTIKAEVEDSFLRRVYRNISEMADEINAERVEDNKNSIFGPEVREEIKYSNGQIKAGIKDFFTSFVPKKKS